MKVYKEERLYSTGSNELDELLERAFCEGYEYAQKEFSGRAAKTGKTAQEIKKILKPTGNRAAKKISERQQAFREALKTPMTDASNEKDVIKVLKARRERMRNSPDKNVPKIHHDINEKVNSLNFLYERKPNPTVWNRLDETEKITRKYYEK